MILLCLDCGRPHATGLEAMICDIRVGRETPGLSDWQRRRLLEDRGYWPISEEEE
jgi:hypothetical protein